MLDLSFQFKESVSPAAQDRLLDRIRHFPGVTAVGRIDPESDVDLIHRMCAAKVNDPVVLEDLQEKLSNLPEIEGVEVPPRRELM